MTLRNRATACVLDDRYNPGELARRRSLIDEHPVGELNAWVRSLRAEEGEETIPWFDPAGGGSNAKVLLLAQDPSEVATAGSGFISADNNDPTANNTTIACNEAGLAARDRCHWNVVPWWVKDPTKPDRSLGSEVRRAARHLDVLLNELLADVMAVVLLGKPAQTSWRSYRNPRDLRVFACPHPSPLAWNNLDRVTGRPNSELTIEALAEARRYVDEHG